MEGIQILNVLDLVKKADIRWKSEAEKRKKHESDLKAKMEAAIAEESKLHKEIIAGKKAVNLLQEDYFELEKKIVGQEKEKVENLGLSEADVLSGKITLKRFRAEGVSSKRKIEIIIEKSLIELEDLTRIIRKKRKKILQQELKLATIQVQVFNYRQYPGEVLLRAYADQKDFIQRELGAIYGEIATAGQHKKQIETQVNLANGLSLGAGYRFNRIRKGSPEFETLIFNPIVPEDLIPELKRLASDFAEGEMLSVVLTMGGGRDPGIYVDPASGYGPQDKRDIEVSKDSK